MPTLFVLEDFRAFMKSVVVYLDTPSEEKFLDSEDAVAHDCGYGGRIDGIDTYRFKYITQNGHHRWDVTLRESQIRDIADGLLIEVEGDRFDIVRTERRTPVGEPLLIWGEAADDALAVHGEQELLGALDAAHASARETPLMLRMWSAADDQLVAVVWGEHCALYIVESVDGYATSTGNQERHDSFEVLDHEGRNLNVPWADCVSWDYGRRAIVRFIEHSDLGDIPVEGRIPSLLLMMGDVDRKAALAARTVTPHELVRTSLPGRSRFPAAVDDEPTAPITIEVPWSGRQQSWARRFLELLHAGKLIELGPRPNLDEISDQLGKLVQARALDAEDSLEIANWLANEIGMVRGISKRFATGRDLQSVLRRLRDVL